MSDIEKVEIGSAVLYRGDCLEAMSLVEHADHAITDPPYETSMHTADRLVKASNVNGGLKKEAHKFEAMDNNTRSEITRMMIEKTKGWLMFFCQPEGMHYWKEAIEKHGGKYSFTGIWVKLSSKPNLSGYSPGMGYESVVSAWCGGGRSSWNGGGRSAVWIHNPAKRTAENSHTSIKPHSLMCELVGLFSNEGQIVLDTFMGSGSTGVAAVSMGRKFIGIERDPEYFDISCRRIEEAQKTGMFDDKPYVRTKSRVAVPMFEELVPKAKVAAPKPRAVAAPKASKPAPTAAPAPAPALKKRFAPPSIKVAAKADKPKGDDRPRLPARTIPSSFDPILKAAAGRIIDFGPWDDEPRKGGAVGLDVECYKNFFLINFERFGNGQRISFEESERSSIDFDRAMRILKSECIITFNGMVYDVPMICMAAKGMGLNELKYASNELIGDRIKYWQVEDHFKIRIPTIDHVDLFEPNPSVRTGLKTLAGRLHAKNIMNLPYKEDAYLSHDQMNVATLYCFEDISHTKSLFKVMREPLTLRVTLGKRYDMDLRSKSDAQVGEALVKKRIEKLLGRRVTKSETVDGSTFNYEVPSFISFQTDGMKELLETIKGTQFHVGSGKVLLPKELEGRKVPLGDSIYKMGIGGLHSTEEHRAIHSDENNVLVDTDVASQYPSIITKLGLFPKALGPAFNKIYNETVQGRLQAKNRIKEIDEELKELKKKMIEVENG